jgi:hypothetical protein
LKPLGPSLIMYVLQQLLRRLTRGTRAYRCRGAAARNLKQTAFFDEVLRPQKMVHNAMLTQLSTAAT